MNNAPMPSYALQIEQEIRPALVGFTRGRKATIDLPLCRDKMSEGFFEFTVGFGKENTMNTFTRQEIVDGLTKAVGLAHEHGPKKVAQMLATEPNLVGLKNALNMPHIVGGNGVNAGKRVNALFHCLAAARRKIRQAAKNEAADAALAVAKKNKTTLGFVITTGRGKNKTTKLFGPYADVKSGQRAYCRAKWTSSWWETTPDMKNSRKAEAMNNISNYNDLEKKYS